MKMFGLEISRAKPVEKLQQVDHRGGWWNLVSERYPGAWQRNDEIKVDGVLGDPTVYACVSLIAADIAKMRLRLVQLTDDGIWVESNSAAFSPVLRKPNRYQTRIQFIQQWMYSKLGFGNTYVLKERDARGLVVAKYVLDPRRVKTLVADNGDVYYEVSRDDLAGQHSETIVIPAREIIHDRMNAFFHPLVGLSPIYAAGSAAVQSLRIQNSSTSFFANGARPGGVLTAPGEIKQDTAQRLKEYWETNFSGVNSGKVAVLGDGLKYEQMMMSAADSQLIEQLKWSAEKIAAVFHVPPYMVGVGAAPLNNNVESLKQLYYAQCLQIHIEEIEAALDEGLALPAPYGTEFDREDLLGMDMQSLMATIEKGIGAGVMAPNEGRRKIGLPPVAGGKLPYLQQQNYSLEALAKRDAENPLAISSQPAPLALPAPDPEPVEEDETERAIAAFRMKCAGALYAA